MEHDLGFLKKQKKERRLEGGFGLELGMRNNGKMNVNL